MPEPLKNLYNESFIKTLCCNLEAAYTKFDSEKFRGCIFDEEWDNKELKQRMRHISQTLHKFLPSDYRESIKILKCVSPQFHGFEPMIFPDFVELYGLNDYKESILALEHFTLDSSSEFAVRPFIMKYNSKMMAQMEKWAESSNYHVRRLASEGCRPRLPWAMALPEFKKDPQPVFKILEKLKNDESEYVRRSVANNLNDISKDNPQKVIEIAKAWLGENSNTNWIVKHACRSLLKQGVPEIMGIFGYVKPSHMDIEGFEVQKSVSVGRYLKFSFNLRTQKSRLGKLRIEYAIHFLKYNGKHTRKVFKISESYCSEQKKGIIKEHSFKVITTRKYYAGIHGITIIVNGQDLLCDKFQLNDAVNSKVKE